MSRLFLLVLVVLALGSLVAADLTVRANLPSLLSSDVWKANGRNGTLVTGPIVTTPALILGNRLYLQVPQAMIALDLQQNTSTFMIRSSLVLSYAQFPTLAATISDPIVRGIAVHKLFFSWKLRPRPATAWKPDQRLHNCCLLDIFRSIQAICAAMRHFQLRCAVAELLLVLQQIFSSSVQAFRFAG